MKKRFTKILKQLKTKAVQTLVTAATCASMMITQIAMATTSASSLLSTIIDIFGKLILVPAVITVIVGLYNFVQGQSDSNGPDAKKGQREMAGGVMLIILSVVLIANKATFAGIIGG